jgi:hypothetical protein
MTKQSPADIRLALLAAGFAPVACIGKAPILPEWPTRHDTPEQIARWGGGNTGVATKYTPGLDADINMPKPAACIEGLVRDWFDGRGIILTRFGRAPRRALLFRTSTPFSKIAAKLLAPDGSKHKLEFLGDGQQLVVHGIHPDTNQPYSWHGGLCPWDMKCEDLVEITEQEAREFLDHAADVLKEQFGFTLDAGGNGHDAQSPFPPDTAPIDVDAQLAALNEASADDAGGVTNDTHIHIIPSLLRNGEHPKDVLEHIVDETMARVGDRLGWSRAVETKAVIKRILSGYNNLLLKDYDPASGVIPDWLPGEFHPAWLRVLTAGGRPMLHFTPYGFCIKSAQQDFSHNRSKGKGTAPEDKRGEDATIGTRSSTAGHDKEESPTRDSIRAIPFKAFDEAKLPPREWLYASHYQRGQVTATIGPGGAGKSSVDLVEALVMATARDLLGEQPTQRCRVWIHNGDDDKQEMDRRIGRSAGTTKFL